MGSKRDFIKSLVRQIPPGIEFTAANIVDMAYDDGRYFIVSATVSNVIQGMSDVETVTKKRGHKVYARVTA